MDPTQTISMVFIVVLLAAEGFLFVKETENRLWSLPVLSFAITSLIFYGWVAYTDWIGVRFDTAHVWAQALRLQGYITLVLLAGLRIYIHYGCKVCRIWNNLWK